MEQTYKEMHLFIFPTFTIEREREREKSISGESGADYKIEITTEKKTPPEFPTDWPSLNTASNEKWENIKSFFPLNIFFFYLSLLLVVFVSPIFFLRLLVQSTSGLPSSIQILWWNSSPLSSLSKNGQSKQEKRRSNHNNSTRSNSNNSNNNSSNSNNSSNNNTPS